MENDEVKTRIAIVGAGVAGIVAAYVLARKYEVTLFEKNSYIGGHTNTITLETGTDKGIAIDTGFIVCNAPNYPNFYKFIGQLGVQLRNSEMSFSHYCARSNLAYCGPALADFLKTPQILLKREFRKLLLDQHRFNSQALDDLKTENFSSATLRDYVHRLGLGDYFVQNYLVPMTAAIWSSPDCSVLDFPTRTFLTFFRNHGMLEFSKRPRWQTVVGGSHSYVRAFKQAFKGKIVADSAVLNVSRSGPQVSLLLKNGTTYSFDKVVLASHADESLKLLQDPSSRERDTLGKWRYQTNHTVLHTDTSVLPPKRALWSCWNYVRRASTKAQNPVSVTYYMNRLQGLSCKTNYCVTLNQDEAINKDCVLYQTDYSHPQYTEEAVKTQAQIRRFNGERNTFFCGSYLGYGFHEDAVSSALEVGKLLGVAL